LTTTSITFFLILLLFIFAITIKQYLKNRKIKKSRNPILRRRFIIRIFLLLLISLLISLTFSNYKGGTKKITNYSMIIDNIIIIDYSTSMISNDIKPNRFEQSKNLSMHIVDNLINSRFALILFGDDPLLEVPLTDNIEFLKNVLSSIQINEEIYRSSNISLALISAIDLLIRSPAIYKNLIVFSDFDFDKTLPIKVKDQITEQITYLFNIVVSSEKGSNIWLPNKNTFLVDKFQNEVFSAPNKIFLSDISKLPNSSILYWDNLNYNSISSILNINKDLATKMEKHETFAARELNYLFGLIGFLLMILYLAIFSDVFTIIFNMITQKNG